MNWKPGDRAQLCNGHSCAPLTCKILSGPKWWDAGSGTMAFGYKIECGVPPSEGYGFRGARPEQLKPIDDDDEFGSWEEIQKITNWQPKELVDA